MTPLSPALIAELRRLGVNVAGDATLPGVAAAIQDRIVHAATVPPDAFDRARYDHLWRVWKALAEDPTHDD